MSEDKSFTDLNHNLKCAHLQSNWICLYIRNLALFLVRHHVSKSGYFLVLVWYAELIKLSICHAQNYTYPTNCMHSQNPDLLSAGNPVRIKDHLLLKEKAICRGLLPNILFASMIRNKETHRCVSLDLYKIWGMLLCKGYFGNLLCPWNWCSFASEKELYKSYIIK